jgi:hypothetical protein
MSSDAQMPQQWLMPHGEYKGIPVRELPVEYCRTELETLKDDFSRRWLRNALAARIRTAENATARPAQGELPFG